MGSEASAQNATPVTTVEFAVDMSCGKCEEDIKSVLNGVAGIDSVNVDMQKQMVLVDTRLPSNTVQELIEGTGRRAVLRGVGYHGTHLGAAVAEFYGIGGIKGVARFVQVAEDKCIIDGTLDGLAPGRHGFAVCQYGDLSDGCESVGEHYNPSDHEHGALENLQGDFKAFPVTAVPNVQNELRLQRGTKLTTVPGKLVAFDFWVLLHTNAAAHLKLIKYVHCDIGRTCSVDQILPRVQRTLTVNADDLHMVNKQIHSKPIGALLTGQTYTGTSNRPYHTGSQSVNMYYKLPDVGDLGNIQADASGRASFRIENKRIKVWDLIGRALAVHAQEDDYGRGSGHRSKIDGNAGPKIACGIIARSAGIMENTKKICSCTGATLWEERDAVNSQSKASSL